MKTKRILAAAALASILSATAAQSQTTLYGCYVKNTGTVYRIKVPGTPTSCGANHTQFVWNMEGQVGPQGPEGPQGPAGPAGWPGVERRFVQFNVVPGTVDLVTYCPSGQVLLTGGYYTGNPPAGFEVVASWPHYSENEPSHTQYGWMVRVRNNTSGDITLRVYAYCRTAIS